MRFEYDDESESLILPGDVHLKFSDPRAFSVISDAWLRVGWDTKYVYGFSWLGRPVIQLPQDLIQIQEVIYQNRPDVIVETGVAHGGSLVFYASVLSAIGSGRVIGVDVEIRPHNRIAIENHALASRISLVEGNSISADALENVEALIGDSSNIMVILDSNHSKGHVLEELRAYSEFVSIGQFIVVCDGIMKALVGAPRSTREWEWDNPIDAVVEFQKLDRRFRLVEPQKPFNEGIIQERVTYWPSAYLLRIS